MADKRISQKDFVSILRTQLPELKDFRDDEIVNKILERRPDLVDKVENPMAGDVEAQHAQSKVQQASHGYGQFSRSVLDALPGIGGMFGGLLGASGGPLTAIGAGALGVGAGRGLRDIAAQGLGLESTTPTQKAANIGIDTTIAALAPGAITALRNPIDAARIGARQLLNIEGGMMPRALRQFVTPSFLENFAAPHIRPTAGPILNRPPWQSGFPLLESEITNDLPYTGAVKEGELVGELAKKPRFTWKPEGPKSSVSSRQRLQIGSEQPIEGEIIKPRQIGAGTGKESIKTPITPRPGLPAFVPSEAQSPTVGKQNYDQLYNKFYDLMNKVKTNAATPDETDEMHSLFKKLFGVYRP